MADELESRAGALSFSRWCAHALADANANADFFATAVVVAVMAVAVVGASFVIIAVMFTAARTDK